MKKLSKKQWAVLFFIGFMSFWIAPSTGDSKIRSLMSEQFTDDEEGFQKARENFMSFCPKMAKADKSQKIQFKAQGKVDSVEDKLKEMKIE